MVWRRGITALFEGSSTDWHPYPALEGSLDLKRGSFSLLLAALALTTSLCLTASVLRSSWAPVLQQT